MHKRSLGVFLSFILLFSFLPSHAQEATEGEALITSPSEGQQLFGLVQIMGTATHPSLFAGYSLDWSNVQNPDFWIPLQPRLSQQVTDGVLGQWDTVAGGVPDGVYQLRLQVFLSDGTTLEFQVSNLALSNSLPTSVPTPVSAIPVVTLPPPESITGATATSIIEQPPTVTPLPTAEQAVVVANSSDEDSGSDLNFNFSAVQGAFCAGIYFTMFLFGLVIAYLVIRSQLSPYTRRLWWQIRSELEDNQKDF